MAHTPNYTYDYLGNVLVPKKVDRTVKMTCSVLRRYEFDGIAFRGMSGALIAPIVAYKLGKPLLLVRKPKYGENSEPQHSCYPLEGDYGIRTYVIIDDFISSGDTVRAIIATIYENIPEARCIGIAEVNHIVDCWKLHCGANQRLTKVIMSYLPAEDGKFYIETTPESLKTRKPKGSRCQHQ